MAPENKGPTAGQFQLTRLPWMVGGGGLLLYLVTLNHWISLQSLGMVARVSGWLWEPQVGRPLAIALFFPFRVLPETWIPLALNLFTAVCAGIILALLARSVALLRQDLGPERPPGKEPAIFFLTGPRAWMPPVIAAWLCGLQLSFWEHATSASGELVDLLVFAYAIRCLLEFRLDPQDRWLWKAACAAGAGMANHWLMVGFFPVFLLALARVKGFGEFLNGRFLLRLSLWTLVGLSLYLLLPLTQGWAGGAGFWPTLRANLQGQAEALSMFRRPGLRLVALTSLLPLLVIAVRWKSHSVQFGDDSRLGVFLVQATGHLVHVVFLLLPIWLALDPDFGPRYVAAGTALLPVYYLSALAFGQCAGYLLLFKGRAGIAARAVNWTLLCAVPLLLGLRNSAQIALTNGPWLHHFAKDLQADVPEGRSVVLAEDAKQLLFLRAELSRHRHEQNTLLVEAFALSSPRYQRYMAERFKARWPSSTNLAENSAQAEVVSAAAAMADKEPVFWLGSGFGPLFERFTGSPKGSLWQLIARKQGEPVRPPNADVTGSGHLWEQRWTNHLHRMTERAQLGRTGNAARESVPGVLRLERERNVALDSLAAFYSRALNTWGVELRRCGRSEAAEVWFERALALNPGNLCARVNREYSRQCRRGDTSRLKPEAARQSSPDLFDRNINWRQNILLDGPVDEPTFLFRTGRVLSGVGLPRQSATEFARSAELAPDWAMPRLWLAQSGLELRDFAGALRLAQSIQASDLPGSGRARLLNCQATALWELGRTNDAVALVESFVERFPTNREVMLAGAGLFERAGLLERDLALLNALLEREPERPDVLMRLARAQLENSDFQAAIATLNKVISLNPTDDDARLSRAIAFLGAERFEEARLDYEWLLRKKPGLPTALFGLATIAWRQHQTNQALAFYQRFLSNAIPGSARYAIATNRLKSMTEKSKLEKP